MQDTTTLAGCSNRAAELGCELVETRQRISAAMAERQRIAVEAALASLARTLERRGLVGEA